MAILQTINPATGQKIADYTLSTEDEIGQRIERAHTAFLNWQEVSLAERSALMNHLAGKLKQQKAECVHLMSTEMGKPQTEAGQEIDKCIWVCQHYAEHAANYLSDQPIATEYQTSYVTYRPIGVIFAIMPWNYPFWQVFRFAAPNLMGGNSALLKHAAIASGCGQKIAALIAEAGFPEGLFQSIIMDSSLSATTIGHPLVAGVTLTGSDRAGRAVARAAGEHLKKVVLELGGSDPYLILDDADLDRAAECIIKSRLSNAGQVCIAAKRVIVHQSVAAALETKILAGMKSYIPSEPHTATCLLGPLARDDLRTTLHQQVQESIAKGATLRVGGRIPAGDGFYYPATLLTNVQPGMPAFDEELFGPVIALIGAKDTEQAIELANQSPYGLGAAVFTRDTAKGEAIAKNRLEAGSCFVNTMVSSDPRLPFGGIRQSGFGRELAAEGIREFMNIKTVVMAK
ncbi:MAG: NAD-dependent succinate-semialdehyde dehydrogenase [Legionellaceae bacterium]|nr:NAD-dependent succinate-semialdehyde dehydrogenase [Legionellaceae bacterium]